MKDDNKTKKQLINELAELRHRLFELEKTEEKWKQTEPEEARCQLEELRLPILSNVSDAVFLTDYAGAFIFICPKVENIFGYSYKEVQKFGGISKLLGEGIFNADELEKGREITNIEREITTKDGRIKVFLINVKRVSIKGGSVLYVCRDITERKRTDKALRESEAKLNAMLQSLSNHMSMMDKDLNIIWANETAKKVFGKDIVGKKCYEVYHKRKEPCEPYPCLTLRAFQDGKAHEQETQVMDKNGEILYFHRTANVALRDKDGRPTAVLEISRDITECKRAEEALREADRMKNEFISTAAHELRTPLTSILGYTELLLSHESFKPEERQEFLSNIYSKAQDLSAIVDDLLTLSRIEPDRLLCLNYEPANIRELIGQVVAHFKKEFQKHQFEVLLTKEPRVLFLDKGKIVQVLENLLSNAVKYSPKGGRITVRGDLVRGRYQVVVEDEGIGMTPEQAGKVFDKFYRADASDTAVPGLGLGMSIAKKTVEAHRGQIWIESELGRGTKVFFTLPINI
jgi:PAS domain S-box-containing protein